MDRIEMRRDLHEFKSPYTGEVIIPEASAYFHEIQVQKVPEVFSPSEINKASQIEIVSFNPNGTAEVAMMTDESPIVFIAGLYAK